VIDLLEDDTSAAVEARELLPTRNREARDTLRRVLIRDQADRDAISSRLMRYRDQNGQDWADIFDLLTMHPKERRNVVRFSARSRPSSNVRRASRAGARRGTDSSVVRAPEPEGAQTRRQPGAYDQVPGALLRCIRPVRSP